VQESSGQAFQEGAQTQREPPQVHRDDVFWEPGVCSRAMAF